MIKRFTIITSLFLLVFALPHAWGYDFFYDVWGSSSSDVFVVGAKGRILHYDGNYWHRMNSDTDGHLIAIWGFSNTDVYVVGNESNDNPSTGSHGIILHYDGNHWSKTVIHSVSFRSIWGYSSSDIYAVGSSSNGGVLLHCDGNFWRIISEVPNVQFSEIWGFSNSDIFIGDHGRGGNLGDVYHYDGYTCTKMPSSPGAVYGLWGSSHSSLYAITYYDEIFHYDGSNWSILWDSNQFNDESSIWGISDTDIFIVRDPEYEEGNDQDILHFNGINFERIPCPSSGFLYDVWGSSGSDIYAVGSTWDSAGLIVHYNGSTLSVVDFTSPPPPPVVVGTPPPSNQSAWNYLSVVNPVNQTNPADCKPFAVGNLSSGNLSLQVGLPAFSSGVDVYLAIGFADALFLIDGSNVLHSSTEVTVLPKWKTNISAAIDESLYGNIPTSLLPSGLYNLYIAVVPTGETDFSHYYFWSTSFSISD